MPWSLVEIHAAMPTFLLVLFRISGLMLSTPFFSGTILPVRMKVMIAMAITLAVFPMMVPHVTVPVTLSSALAGLIGELVIGLFVGFGVALVLLGVQVALQLIGHQSGMALGEVFNPMFESSSTAVSQLYQMVALMIFLCVGGHLALVRTLLDSFATMPPLGFRLTEGLAGLLVNMLSVSFELAIRVGGPAILALLLAFLALGFVSRTMPQLNIFTVGFPLKLASALIILAITIMSLESVLIEALTVAIDNIRAGLDLPPMVS